MARASDGQDYYVDEPALANVDKWGSLAPVVPVRFFEQHGQMMVRAHKLTSNPEGTGFVIQVRSEEDCIVLPLASFLLSYPNFLESHVHYNLPSPRLITGIVY